MGVFFHDDLDRVWEQSRLQSLPTHVHPLGIEGAQLLATAVALAVQMTQYDREAFFGELLARCESDRFREKIEIASRAERRLDLEPLGNGIEAFESVATAIACFALTPYSYEETISRAIFLGGDTDTIAAMAGAISGAFLGVEAISPHLIETLEETPKGKEYLRELGQRLHKAYDAGVAR